MSLLRDLMTLLNAKMFQVKVFENIIQSLRGLNLQPKLCRAQTYDGADNMAGQLRGCADHFQGEIPEAV